jgi:hypothetical protein
MRLLDRPEGRSPNWQATPKELTMTTIQNILVAGLTGMFSHLALATDIDLVDLRDARVQVKSVTAGGSGCVGGNVGLMRNDAREVLATLQFDDFEVDVRQNKSLDRKFCALMIELKIPAGYSVGAPVAIAEGFVETRGSATVQLKTETSFWRGSAGPKLANKEFKGANYQFFSSLISTPRDNGSWSPCINQNPVLKVHVSMLARSTSYSGSAYASLGSIKILDPQLVGGLALRRCR